MHRWFVDGQTAKGDFCERVEYWKSLHVERGDVKTNKAVELLLYTVTFFHAQRLFRRVWAKVYEQDVSRIQCGRKAMIAYLCQSSPPTRQLPMDRATNQIALYQSPQARFDELTKWLEPIRKAMETITSPERLDHEHLTPLVNSIKAFPAGSVLRLAIERCPAEIQFYEEQRNLLEVEKSFLQAQDILYYQQLTQAASYLKLAAEHVERLVGNYLTVEEFFDSSVYQKYSQLCSGFEGEMGGSLKTWVEEMHTLPHHAPDVIMNE